MAECKHGLDDQWCASCKHPLPASAQRDRELGPPFKAKYSGYCPECREAIEVGDPTRACDGRYFHADCTS